MQDLVITLDGPAGSGKSTVARLLAQRLGLAFLDTGAMYRGLTARCLDQSIDPDTQPTACTDLARQATLTFDWTTDPPRLSIDGTDVTDRLRDADVTHHVSAIAAMPALRKVLVEAQRQIGREHPRLVTEGRDQGSVVFPHARVKFFIDASPTVRARRRAQQLRDAGREADEAAICEQIIARDHRDANRTEGPLMRPADAIVLDTSAMSLAQVLDALEKHVRDRVPALKQGSTAAGEERHV